MRLPTICPEEGHVRTTGVECEVLRLGVVDALVRSTMGITEADDDVDWVSDRMGLSFFSSQAIANSAAVLRHLPPFPKV